MGRRRSREMDRPYAPGGMLDASERRRVEWERHGLWPTPTGPARTVVKVAFGLVLLALVISVIWG